MSRFVAPYGIRFRDNGRIEVFPAIEVDVLGRKGRGIHAIFHIDSGATTSALTFSDARELGISINLDRKIIIRGVSGEEFPGYRDIIHMEFNGLKLNVPAVFIDNPSLPRVLGREGVFLRFGIFFDEARRRTGFFCLEKERHTIDTFFEGK